MNTSIFVDRPADTRKQQAIARQVAKSAAPEFTGQRVYAVVKKSWPRTAAARRLLVPLVPPPPKTGDRDNVVEEVAGELVSEAADVADNGEEAVEGEDITPTK